MDDDQRRSAVRRAVIAFVAAGILLVIDVAVVAAVRDDRGDRWDRLDDVREQCRDGDRCGRWDDRGPRFGPMPDDRGMGPGSGRSGSEPVPGGPRERNGSGNGGGSDDGGRSDGAPAPTRPGAPPTTTPSTTVPSSTVPAAGGA